MGLQLEIPPGRTLTVRGTKKVIRKVQRINATTHSYTVHIQMNANGQLCPTLPVVLYEPSDMPKRPRETLGDYENLQVYWSTSGKMGKDIAKDWMENVFLKHVAPNSLLILDSWNGYKEMMQMPEIQAKKLKIVTLPAKTTGRLQPADVYFNRPFKSLFRRICNKVRWRHNNFILSQRANLLSILDMLYYQCKAPRFQNLLKYAWYRAGFLKKHPDEFKTPIQYCLKFRGYMKCEAEACRNLCFFRCAYCGTHYCFKDILNHRH